MGKRIYLICPVRNVSPSIKVILDNYVATKESQGDKVHYPHRDVNQNDETGLGILLAHRTALEESDWVHAYWMPCSEGSVGDLNMALVARKPFMIINKNEVYDWLLKNPGKSYTRVALELDRLYQRGRTAQLYFKK